MVGDGSNGDDDHRARVARRIAWWLGVVPSLCSAVVGAVLILLPGLYGLPQRDRPYGWLTDRLAVGSGWLLLGASLLFALLAIALFVHARRIATGGRADGDSGG